MAHNMNLSPKMAALILVFASCLAQAENGVTDRDRAIGARDLIVDNLKLARDPAAGGESTRNRE